MSDRLYYTGKDVIEANKARFEAFFRKVNALMGIRDFPAHVELRVEGDRILPIEFQCDAFRGPVYDRYGLLRLWDQYGGLLPE